MSIIIHYYFQDADYVTHLNSIYRSFIQSSVFVDYMLANQRSAYNTHVYDAGEANTTQLLNIIQDGGIYNGVIYSGGLKALICKIELKLKQLHGNFEPTVISPFPQISVPGHTEKQNQHYRIIKDIRRLIKNQQRLFEDTAQ